MPAANDPENDGAWLISRPIAVTLNALDLASLPNIRLLPRYYPTANRTLSSLEIVSFFICEYS